MPSRTVILTVSGEGCKLKSKQVLREKAIEEIAWMYEKGSGIGGTVAWILLDKDEARHVLNAYREKILAANSLDEAVALYYERKNLLAAMNLVPAGQQLTVDEEPEDDRTLMEQALEDDIDEDKHEVFKLIFENLAGGEDYLDDAKMILEEKYQGEWRSAKDWLENYIEETDMMHDWPELATRYFDADMYLNDLFKGGDIQTLELDGKIHVFFT